MIRPCDKVYLCKTPNSDAAFTASKWIDLTSNVASGFGAAQTNGDIGESWEDISSGHASGDVLGITVAGTVSYTRSIMQVFSSGTRPPCQTWCRRWPPRPASSRAWTGRSEPSCCRTSIRSTSPT